MVLLLLLCNQENFCILCELFSTHYGLAKFVIIYVLINIVYNIKKAFVIWT
jgi:hypothetical protein